MTRPTPRILYTSFDEVPGPKGAVTHIEAFVGALGQQFGNVVLATPGPADVPLRPFAPGVRHRVLGCPGDNPIGRARTFRAKLAAWLRRESFDILHFRSIFEGFPLIDPAVRRGARLVYEVNGFPSIELKYHYRKLAADDTLGAKLVAQENDCLRAADRIITVSEVNRRHIVARGVPAERIAVIRNGVDPHAFEYRPPPAIGDGPLRVAYVGTLATWQGIETLLEAIELTRKHRAVKVRLMGAGSRSRRAELDRVAGRLRLEDGVEFLPGGHRRDVLRLLHDSHVAVVPLLPVDRNTAQGCCPLKLLEAMAAGCPVVASDLPVVRELAEPDVHFLPAHPGDARNLKNALVAMAESPDLAKSMADRARAHVVANLTWQHAADRLFEAYESILDERAVPVPD